MKLMLARSLAMAQRKNQSVGEPLRRAPSQLSFSRTKKPKLTGISVRPPRGAINHGSRCCGFSTAIGPWLELTKERIEKILAPYADRPGAALSLLKMLRILIQHAMQLDRKNHLRIDKDPSTGIARPEIKEIRAWTDAECAAYETRWPIGTKQRTAYALMLYVGTARVDVHRMTWRQLDDASVRYTRNKTGVGVETDIHSDLQKALSATPREHITLINTEYGKPFTVAGFSGFMRDAITRAGLPLDCKPHGLRKTLGRRMADVGCTAHQIMAMLGHTTLEEAERYTREADRRLGARQATAKLEGRERTSVAQTESGGFWESV